MNDSAEVTPSVLWEGGTAVIQGKILEISSRLTKLRIERQKELEDKINNLENEHKQIPIKKPSWN